jgi:hypothetical protein
VLRSVTGLSLANGVTPAIDQNALFVFDQINTEIYNLSTLTLEKTLTGSRASVNSPYNSPGAIQDTHFLLDYGPLVGQPGFDVYTAAVSSVPEPSVTVLATVGAATFVLAGRMRMRRPRSMV